MRDDLREAAQALLDAIEDEWPGLSERSNWLGSRVGALREALAGVAAGPQATPQVLWEGHAGQLGRELHNQGTRKVLGHGPSDLIRVVAAPTSQEHDHE